MGIQKLIFKSNIIDRHKAYNEVSFDSGGVIVNFEREKNLDKVYYLDDNIHLLVVGSSGSGKSMAVKHLIYNELPSTKILVIDPEDEYSYLCKKLKGRIIDCQSP